MITYAPKTLKINLDYGELVIKYRGKEYLVDKDTLMRELLKVGLAKEVKHGDMLDEVLCHT